MDARLSNATLAFPPFEPHPWVAGASAMTVVASLPRPGVSRLVRAAERRVVRVDDRTGVLVEVDRPPFTARSALVVLHGLVGSSRSGYVLGTARAALAAGFVVARVNARNCGDTEELTRDWYHGGQTEELDAVARDLVERDGVDAVHLAGFSIGGNQVLALAARWGAAPPPWARSVSAVSPCIDFALAARALDSGSFQRLVQRRFLSALRRIATRRHRLDHGRDPSPGAFRGIRTIREFDERFTAPCSGFADVEDYYRRASVRGRLDRIRVPTALLVARDDPLVPFESFHGLEPGLAPLRLAVSQAGGHVAFLGARPAGAADGRDLDRRWAEHRVVQFARARDRLARGG